MEIKNDQRELANAAACSAETTTERSPLALESDTTADLAMMAGVSEVLLAAAEQCDEDVAKIAHDIRCLRAARGGTGGTSQTAANHLAHHRLKSVPLADARRSLLEAVFKTQDALKPLLIVTAKKLLELEIHRANLQRCDAAIERDAEEKAASKAGVLTQARHVVTKLARRGVLEGHWSTIRPETIDKIADLIMADNVAAGVGSPDHPREDWKRVSRDQ